MMFRERVILRENQNGDSSVRSKIERIALLEEDDFHFGQLEK